MGQRGRVGSALVALVIVVVAFGWPVYVHPRVQTASPEDPVDAVIALGGPIESAVYAEKLAKQGVTRNVVFSEGFGIGPDQLAWLCDPGRSKTYTITCFRPDPWTTRGEARAIRDLAEEHHWTHVVVVAPEYHVSRARLIVGRCYDGQLDLVPPPDLHTGLRHWAFEYVYQTAGFAKTLVLRGC